MDIYVSSLVLGGLGLGAMALGGHHAHGQTHGHAHTHVPVHTHAHRGPDTHTHAVGIPQSRLFWLLSWPRVLFGFLLGLGAVGIATQGVVREPFALTAAIAGGLIFQRFIITPLWDFSLRFASTPAVTSEGADEATAVTAFNPDGEGVVALEVDGQLIQVLGRLSPADREFGAVVRAGQRLRVEDVNTSNNRCTVSIL